MRTETAGLLTCVQSDLLETMIEDTHGLLIPTHPDMLTHVFRWRGVIRSRDFDVAVAMDPPRAFFETWESCVRQRFECRPFYLLEELPDLFLGSPVDSLVRHMFFPRAKMIVLCAKTVERMSLQRVVL